jgi:hypothetical protein
VEWLGRAGFEGARAGSSFAAFGEPDVVLVVAGFVGPFSECVELADSLAVGRGKNDSVDDDDALIHD